MWRKRRRRILAWGTLGERKVERNEWRRKQQVEQKSKTTKNSSVDFVAPQNFEEGDESHLVESHAQNFEDDENPPVSQKIDATIDANLTLWSARREERKH